MPKSEIDDIFASKGKAKAIQPVASSSSAAPEIKGQKKKKKSQAEPIDNDAKSTTKKRPAPETVIDPSTQLPSAKRAKIVAAKKQPAKDADQEAKDTFKDSRGSGPRRKTEEGFSIFKEAELGIGDQGGDTPLCPFDCQCCF